MNNEDKQLLLIELCSRFPYGVKVDYPLWHNSDPEEVVHNIDGSINKVKDFLTIRSDVLDWKELPKPYLRPLSSMTDLEIGEFFRLQFKDVTGVSNQRHICGNSIAATVRTPHNKEDVRCWYNDLVSAETIDFLNSHMLDWRNMIGIGLAVKALDGMYDIIR